MKLKRFVFKKWKFFVILFVFLILFIFFKVKNKNNNFKTATVQKGKISEELVLSGEINATNYAKLSFETSGKIIYVAVSEGDIVKKGKLLSKLDTTLLNSNYQIALSNLRLYEAVAANVYDQVKNHSNDETFVQKELRTTAEVNKDKAYESVLQAKRNLDGASLVAPFNGIITYVAHPYGGVYSTLGTTEIEIIDPSTIYFSVLADQTEIIKLTKGQKVSVVLDAFSDQVYKGIVTNLSFVPKEGESGSVYQVKVSFEGINLQDSRFKIGMTGDAQFIVSEKEDAFYVPTNFVKQDKTGNYLKINKKDKLYIKTGIESSDFIEVIGDVEEGLVIYD